MTVRNRLNFFDLANPIYSGGTVNIYTVDGSGVKTTTLITLYENATGSATVSNPQVLNSDGRFAQDVWVEDAVIASINGVSIPSHDTGVVRLLGVNKGDWVTSTVYQIGDQVNDGANGDNTRSVYTCAETHTSGTWAPDLAALKWSIFFDSSIDYDIFSSGRRY